MYFLLLDPPFSERERIVILSRPSIFSHHRAREDTSDSNILWNSGIIRNHKSTLESLESQKYIGITKVHWNPKTILPPKTNKTMEHPPFEDVFPIENAKIVQCHVSFQGGNHWNHWNYGIFMPFFMSSCWNQQFQAECPFTTNAQTSIIFQFLLHQMPFCLFHQSNIMYPWDERYIYLHWSPILGLEYDWW